MFFSKGQRCRTGILAVTFLVLMAGCSESSSGTDEVTSREPSHTAPADEARSGRASDSGSEKVGEPASPTRGGDGSEISLNALTETDLGGANLSGELACQFMAEDAGPLLFARGNVDSFEPAQGVVKVAGYVERVSASGGFDGMTDSPTFHGKGKTVHVRVTDEPSEGGESPPRLATLTYDRADGAQRTWTGQWRCGP